MVWTALDLHPAPVPTRAGTHRLPARLPDVRREPTHQAAPGRRHAPRGRGPILIALATAILLFGLTTSSALAATTVTPKCNGVSLRTGPGTTYTKKTTASLGAKLTVVATVSGGSWTATCGGSLAGSSWYRISAINGKSVSSTYGVTYLYSASKLYTTVTTPTAAPTATPKTTAAPTKAPAAAPTATPTAAPTATPVPTTTVTPKCDAVNLRASASTSGTKKTSVNTGANLTVVATVTGGSYSTTCGTALSGTSWLRISAINGKSVSSLYGVTYVYGASKLFKTVTAPAPTASPTASPTAAPTATPTAAPTATPTAPTTAAPTTAPSAAPTTAPTTDPGPSADPSASPDTGGSPAPSETPAPTSTPGPSPTANPVTLPASMTFYGRGYGHGVGLSQYGAYGRALDGQLAEDIVAHYFQGTHLGMKDNIDVRVLVLEAFAATATDPVVVYGRGGTWTIDGVNATFPADAKVKFIPTVSGTTTTWKIWVGDSTGTGLYSGATSNDIRIRPGSGATIELWSKPSAYDQFRGVIRLIGKTDGTSTVNGINELPLESYLRGVVGSEVPSTWPIEAVKAQAIAARSYAAYHLHPSTGTYDVNDDTRSQVYHGYLGEKAGSNTAISATAGVVVRTTTGGLANTMFSSCAGGWTENNENVFTSSTGAKTAGVYSYLRGVSDRRPDGTSYDEASPYDTWKTKTYTLAQIQAWFAADSRTNVGTLVKLDLHDRGVSGRLISVTLIGANGTTKKVSGAVFTSVFNAHRPSGDAMMRSTLFDLIPIP